MDLFHQAGKAGFSGQAEIQGGFEVQGGAGADLSGQAHIGRVGERVGFKQQPHARIFLIALKMVRLSVNDIHVGVDQGQVFIERHLEVFTEITHFQRAGPQHEVRVDDQAVHLLRGGVCLAQAGRFDPAAPTAGAVSEIPFTQGEIIYVVPLLFKLRLKIKQIVLQRGWGSASVQNDNFHEFLTFAAPGRI